MFLWYHILRWVFIHPQNRKSVECNFEKTLLSLDVRVQDCRKNIVDCDENRYLVIAICHVDTEYIKVESPLLDQLLKITCLSTAWIVRLYENVLAASQQRRIAVVSVSTSCGTLSIYLIAWEYGHQYRWSSLSWRRSYPQSSESFSYHRRRSFWINGTGSDYRQRP